ncbi:MAG TPA: hypothetical protein VK806_05125 [Bacteroidia bacterium]|nr:hypothetical protein [Bacteroidia bacterium]
MKAHKYYIIILCILLISFSDGNHRKHKTGWGDRQLNGKVKSCKMLQFHAILASGTISKESKSPYYESYCIFDSNGNEIESGGHSYQDKTSTKIINTYEPHGYCIKTIAYQFNGKDTAIQATTNKFDDKGNKIESELSLLSGTDNVNTPVKAIYKYDSYGNLIQWHYIKGNDTIPPMDVYTYDNDGNLLEDDYYNATDNIQTRTMNSYDAKGSKSNTTEYWYINEPGLRKKAVCRYDEHGNIIEAIEYDVSGKLLAKGTFTVYYDKRGNCVRQIEYLNNKPVSILECEIVYYP